MTDQHFPKPGTGKRQMRAVRQRDLINAAIAEISLRGIGDVTVQDIAGRAGVSSGLAHHYFGSKERLLFETMRHLLRRLAAAVADRRQQQSHPRAAISAIISASLSAEQFSRPVVAAWLAFYVHATHQTDCARLLHIYHRRTISNLTYYLVQLIPRAAAVETAHGVAALIDGFYIRGALAPSHTANEISPDAGTITERYVDAALAASLSPSRG